MKLVRRNIERDQGGVLVLVPEDEEDMWHVYNLISVGDSGKKVKVRMSFQTDTRQMPFPVRASTIRSVTSESATGTTKKERVRLTLTLTIEDIDYDTEGRQLTKQID